MIHKTVSVLIPCRNRSGRRLDACLHSLRTQHYPIEQVEIVVSDFGSDVSHAAALKKLCDSYDCRLVRTETDAMWNRSRALNLALQEARGDYVVCTDVDILFAPNFLSTVCETLSRENTFVVCRCRDLLPETEEIPFVPEAYDALHARSKFRHLLGTGACQAVRKEWFFDVRGYDEKYVYWGYEDRDMFRRATRGGLEVVWIHERTSMLHQWHPKMDKDRVRLKYMNRFRYFLTGWIVKKNRAGWGNLP